MSKITQRKENVLLAVEEIQQALQDAAERLIAAPETLQDEWGNMTLTEKNDHYSAIINELYWDIDSSLKVLQSDLSLTESGD